MASKIKHLALWFLHPAMRNDRQDRILALSILSLFFLSTVFLIFFGALFYAIKYYYGTLAAAISLVFTLVAIVLLKVNKERKYAAFMALMGNYIGFLIFISTSGGLHSPTSPWLIVLPIFAFLFARKSAGYWWAGIVALTYIGFFLAGLFHLPLPDALPKESVLIDEFFSTFGVLVFILIMILTYEALANYKNEQLLLLLEENKEKQQELQMQQEELKAQNEYIAASESKIRTILELLPDAVMIIDEQGRVVHWNKALERLTGVKAEQIVGQGDYAYSIPFYGDRRPILIDLVQHPTEYLKENYKNIEVADGVLKAEAYVPDLRGQRRYLIGIATALYDDKGNYTGAIEVIHDITELKHAQEELQAQNEEILQQKEEILAQRDAIEEASRRISTILELLPDAVMIIDDQGRVTHWNKAIERMTGIKAEEIVGLGDYAYAIPFYGEQRPILIDLAKEPTEYLEKNYQNIEVKDGVLKAEAFVPDLRGERRYLIGIATALYDEQGNYSGAIEVIHDITELKEAEEELREQNEEIMQQKEEIMAQRDAIEEAEKRISTILELLPDAVLIIDDKGRVTHWNKALERMTGVKADDIIGLGNYEYALPFYGRRRPLLIDLVRQPTGYLKKNYQNIEVYDNILKAETFVPNLRGKRRYVIAIATALYDDKGNYIGAVEVIHDITELKETQMELQLKMELLQKSEQRIRKIIDFLPNALFIVNKEGVITHWNKTLEELTGYPASQMVGKGNYEYAIPFFGERKKLLVDFTKYEIDYIKQNFPNIKIRGKNLESDATVNIGGETKYLIGSATALHDEKGQYDGAIEIIVDITERRKEKLKLKYLSLVASNTDNAVIIMDKTGNIEWVNSAFERIYGYTLEQLKQYRGGNIRDAWRLDSINDFLDKIYTHKKSFTIQTEEQNKDGHTIYTQTTISPILSDQGEIINLVAISTDITEIVKYEKQLRLKNQQILQQKNQLAASEERIRKILESIPDAAFVIDQDGRVVYWNKAIEDMTGVPAEQIIGKGDYEYAIPFYGERREILIDLVNRPDEYVEQNYSSVKREKGFLKAESYVPNVRGEERYLIGVAAAIYDSKGDYAGAIEIIHDITPMKRAKEAIEKSQREIMDSLRYAKHIQEAILPTDDILNKVFREYFILYKAKQYVSGDFYWVRELGDKLVIAVADCTGHGVPGALISMLGYSFLNDIINDLGDRIQTNLVLDMLRERIKKSLSSSKEYTYKDGMDMAFAIIDTRNMKMQFSGAYNPALVVRTVDGEKQVIKIKADRQPIGLYLVEKPFSATEFQLNKNDMIYMFSDGYADQLGPSHKGKFTMRRFKELLSEISDLPVNQQEQVLWERFEQWKGDYYQLDDVLILGFRV